MNGHVTLIRVENPSSWANSYRSALDGDEAAHDPESKAAPDARRFFGLSDKVLREVGGQSRTLIANFDRERALRGVGSQTDGAALRRRGASVDQEIEDDLPDALAGDGKEP